MKKQTTTRRNFNRFLGYLRQHKRLAIGVACLSFVSGLFVITGPIIMKLIIDSLERVLGGTMPAETGIKIFLGLVGIYLLIGIANQTWASVMRFYAGRLATILQMKCDREAFKKFTRLHMAWFDEIRIGAEFKKLEGASESIWQSTFDFSISLLPMIITIITLTVGLFFIDPRLVGLMFLPMPIFGWYTYRTSKSVRKKWRDLFEKWEKFSAKMHDLVDNIRVVKVSAAEKREDHKHSLFAQSIANERDAIHLKDEKILFVKNILFIFGYGSALIFGGLLAFRGEITLGEYTFVFMTIGRLREPLFYIVGVYERFHRDLIKVYRLFAFLDLPEKVQDQIDAKDLQVTDGTIEFKNVTFHYIPKKPILKNISFKVQAGETVALVGASGAGKTTITNLLLRFSDIQRGQILIDGQDIARVTQTSLREQTGPVLQDLNLFQKSLRANIRYGRIKASDRAVTAAAKAANAHGFISKLPKGYASSVGQKGVKLSGGEKQRVAIARAFLKDAPILILDEATSHHDSESEKLIQDALDRLTKNRTTIIIAHRLSTVQRADHIIVLDNGRVKEIGKHSTLIRKKDGIYRKLWERQIGGFLGE